MGHLVQLSCSRASMDTVNAAQAVVSPSMLALSGPAAQRKEKDFPALREGYHISRQQEMGRMLWLPSHSTVWLLWPGDTAEGRELCTLTLETHPRETPLKHSFPEQQILQGRGFYPLDGYKI